MRILHVVPYSDMSNGGPVVAVRNLVLATLFENPTAQVSVATIFDKRKSPIDCGFREIEDVSSILRFDGSFPAVFNYSRTMNRWLRWNVSRFDVVHLHVPLTFCNVFAGLLCEQKQIPYVISPHGCLDKWSVRTKSLKKSVFMTFFGHRLIEASSSIHVTSNFEDKNLTIFESSVPRKVIGLPIWFSDLKSNIKNNYDRNLSLISVARIDRVKNFELLFHALKILKDRGIQFEFKIVGDGDDRYKNELLQLSSHLGLDGQVIWLGQVPPAEVRKLLCSSSCFLSGSRHENFGLAAVEALALGIPAVLSDQVAIASDVNRFGAGYMVPLGDPRSFADAIENVHNPKSYYSFCSQAEKYATENYSLAASGRLICDMYRSVI